ncbi:MAG: DUF983 domain-containing protein [Chitinophagales bacterium]
MFKKLKAILFAKCPNCYKGNLFLDSNPYHIKNMDKMHENCPNCNLDYSNETGFYWLSMYTGYFLSGVLSVVFFLIYTSIYGFLNKVGTFVILNTILMLVLIPMIFRWSRSLTFHLAYKMDKS